MQPKIKQIHFFLIKEILLKKRWIEKEEASKRENDQCSFIQCSLRNPLVVRWLGLHAFTAKAWVQFLVEELRSLEPCRVAKKPETTQPLPQTR